MTGQLLDGWAAGTTREADRAQPPHPVRFADSTSPRWGEGFLLRFESDLAP
jgi:hypothetical protein